VKPYIVSARRRLVPRLLSGTASALSDRILDETFLDRIGESPRIEAI
jgi:hypothetical protein